MSSAPLVVVGGHSRNVGKTAVAEALLRAMPDLQWTAVKLTRLHGQVCGEEGKVCVCAAGVEDIDLAEEAGAASGTDTARFLAAGARRAIWLRARDRALPLAAERLAELRARGEALLVESNSLVRLAEPDLCVVALRPTIADFKPSAHASLERADALVVAPPGLDPWPWPGVDPGPAHGKPVFASDTAGLAALGAWARSQLPEPGA